MKSKLLKYVLIDKLNQSLVANLFYTSQVLKKSPLEDSKSTVQWMKEMDCQRPSCFYPAYELSGSVVVRSQGSGDIKR